MDLLWAPWREQYVNESSCSSKRKKPCVFCSILKKKQDARHFIFFRSAHSFSVLNIYPFNGGHTLVIPQRHVADLSDLSPSERQDLMDLLLATKALLSRALKPDAFNVGANIGAMAGAGIPDHLHFHVVPRWRGDVNFMPALFGTKVMPVSLRTVYKRLMDAKKRGH
ncbi:MAG: HIT domain-containing protein [Elusimicrobia bacterium]|nr:HIT domain-containing protein [Elusimicrobiota bacterium]